MCEPRLLLCSGPAPAPGLAGAVREVIENAGGLLRNGPGGSWRPQPSSDIRHAITDVFRDYGNTFATANPVGLKPAGTVSVKGTIGYVGDVDMFVIAAPQTGEVNLRFGSSGLCRMFLGQVTVYDRGGKVLAGGTQAARGNAVAIHFSTVSGGTYYVKVAGKSGGLDKYVLGFSFVPTPLNHAPVAQNDAYAVDEDAMLTASMGVLANDADADGDELAAALVTGPSHGSLALNPDGTFTYTPAADFNGTDTFTYKANDGQADSNPATVTLTVRPVNDAPLAQSDAYTMDENGTLAPSTSLLAIATDADGDALDALLVSGPSHGILVLNVDGMFTYQPAADFTGTDSFAYKVNDGQADSNVATITITVNPLNQPPVAQDDGYSVDQDNVLADPVGVLHNDTDPNGDPLTAVLVDGPANGDLALNPDGTFTYAPNAGWSGTDTFTYKANDGQADSNVATVTLTVRPVVQLPVANDDSYTVNVNGTLNVSGKGILANDTNPTGDTLFANLTDGVKHGNLYLNGTGSFMYIPTFGFTGTDTFTYVASGTNGMSNTATVTISVV
jgi:VCBS repeat-containing protein